MNKPLVSIIIPTYNRAGIIGETLDSLLAQTYPHWECIVVDDGSEDNTETLIAGYLKNDSRFKYSKRSNTLPKGPNGCRNYGFTLSRGDFVLWFDSDDLFKYNALEVLVRSCKDGVDAIVAQTNCIDLVTNRNIKTNKIHSENLIEDYFIGKITFYIGGVLWNRSFLKKQNTLFDSSIGNMDDWDFNLRMLYDIPNIVFISKVLFTYRLHQNSFSNEMRKFNKKEILSEFNARKKHLKLIKGKSNVKLKKIIYPFILRTQKRYLRHAMAEKNVLVFFLFRNFLMNQIKFGCYRESFQTIKKMIKYYLFK